jgi:steroid delta-isomerase-like uncharacterized protein
MPAQEEALARRFFEEMCNGRRLDIAGEILTQDHRYHDPNSPSAVGPAAMAEVVAGYQDGVEGHWEIRDILSSGDRVAVRWTGTGTHSGDVMGIPPTGARIEVEALTVLRIENGRIAENWTVWDTLGLLRQLGVVPSPEAAAAGA